MTLKNKIAIIYGAAGAIGSTVTTTFAREGAQVFLAGRNLKGLEKVAAGINESGGFAHVSELDALDENAVDQHLQMVITKTGGVDISFNAIGLRNTTLQGIPLANISIDQFMAPIIAHVQTNFIISRLAGRHMSVRNSGVIMSVTSIPSRNATPLMGGVAIAMAAEEALLRDLSVELGPSGVRVLGVRTQAMPDSGTIKEVFGIHAKAYNILPEQFQQMVADRTHRKRLPSLQELAEVVAFMASENASAMSGTIVNMSLGSIAD